MTDSDIVVSTFDTAEQLTFIVNNLAINNYLMLLILGLFVGYLLLRCIKNILKSYTD